MGNKTNGLIKTMTIKDIQETIEEFLPVRKIEKDKYGEVFTPQELIEEILGKLPKDVWSNPDLKWLDPANGIGNFPMVAYTHLMEGLTEWETNEDKRSNHIIENMLYMVELNEKNVGVSKKIFGDKANIHCGDFLEADLHKIFGIEKFDIIMGNPPFNKERIHTTGTNAGKTILWDKFIINSLDLLINNGYLGFIHPANWRGLGQQHHLWNIMSKKQVLYLHIYGTKYGLKFFNVGSRFDLYVLQNKDNKQPTKIIDELGGEHSIRMNELSFLPNYNYNTIQKIITNEENGINVIYDTVYHSQKIHKQRNDTYVYPIVHTITKDGLGLWYANDNTRGHFGIPKLILNKNVKQYSFTKQNDYNGKMGMSELSFGIPISSKKEGDLILKAIDTPQFKEIIASTKWGAFQTDYRMFKFFKKDWYKYFINNNPHLIH
jgi:hypothetical protein